MTLIQYLIAMCGIFVCLWVVRSYIAEAGIKMILSIVLVVLFIFITLQFCGVSLR